MTARKLIFVKHSMAELVPTVPSEQWHLSDLGRARAKILAEKLAAYEPNVVVSSMSPKAMETARIVAEAMSLPCEGDADLRENDRTGFGFVGEAELQATLARFFREPQAVVMGTESADVAHARFSSAVARSLEKFPEGNLVIVAHGTVITLFVSHKLGLEPFAFWKRLGLPSVVVLSLPTFEIEKVVENVE